jgi:hypothetical protein
MTPTEIRTTVRTLQAQGHSLREISRLLALSRNTVRRILRAPDGNVVETPPCDEATLVPYQPTLDTFCIKKSHQIRAGMRTLWVTWQSAAVALRPIRVR